MFHDHSLSTWRHMNPSVATLAFLVLSLSTFAVEIPTEVIALQEASQRDMQGKSYDSAREKYEVIIRKYPDAEFAATARGKIVELCIESGQRAKADEALDEMMSHSDASQAFKEALERVGEAYRWTVRDHAKCRELYSRWLEKFSDDPEAFRFQSRLIQALVEGKQDSAEVNRALQRFKELCKGKTDVAPVLRYLAQVFRDNGHTDTSLALCLWFIEAFADSEQASLIYASIIDYHYLAFSKRVQADALVETLMARSSTNAAFKEALEHVGEAYRWKTRDYAKCREIYSRWLEKFSDDPEAFRFQSRLIQVLVEGKEDGTVVGRALERFKELCKGKADTEVLPILRYTAQVIRDNGHLDASLALCQWYIDAFSDSEQINSLYAVMIDHHCLASNKRARADALLEVLMSRSDTSAAFKGALEHVGEAYRWKTGDHAKCREIYSRWLEKYSGDPEAFRFQSRLIQALAEGKAESAEVGRALERFKELCKGKADADVFPIVRYTAQVIRDNGHQETSLALCQWFIDTFTNSEQANSMYAIMIDQNLRLNNRARADALADALMARSDTSAAFKEVLNQAGQAYRGVAKDPAKEQEIYRRWVEKFSEDPEAFKLQSAVVLSLLEANDMEGVGKAMERFKQLCEGKADVFKEMAYLGLNFRNRRLFGNALDLYHWYTGQSPSYLEKFLEVYASVQGFKDEVNDALDKSDNPRARADFMDQLLRLAGRSREPAKVISFYAEHCGGQLGENAFQAILQMVGDNMNPPIGLLDIMNILDRYKMGATSVQLCQSFLAEHPKSEHRPMLQLKIYESMLASGTEATTVISLLDDYLKGDVPKDSELAGKAITMKGKAYIQLAESVKAMDCFTTVIREYPQYPSTSQAMFFLGYCYLMANDFEQSRQTLESMIKNYPNSEYDVRARSLLERIADMT